MDKDVSRHGQKWLAFWSKNYLAVTLDSGVLQKPPYCNKKEPSLNSLYRRN